MYILKIFVVNKFAVYLSNIGADFFIFSIDLHIEIKLLNSQLT